MGDLLVLYFIMEIERCGLLSFSTHWDCSIVMRKKTQDMIHLLQELSKYVPQQDEHVVEEVFSEGNVSNFLIFSKYVVFLWR